MMAFAFLLKVWRMHGLLFKELLETPISYIDDQLMVQRRIPQKQKIM